MHLNKWVRQREKIADRYINNRRHQEFVFSHAWTVKVKKKEYFIYIQIYVMTLNTPCVLCLVNTLELIEIGIHTDLSLAG